MEKLRCPWAKSDSEIAYHDERKLFEFLILEGMQAGLSWKTILDKRENMRLAFDHFDPELIARYNDNKTADLLKNPGIIRNRLKIKALVGNANAYLQIQQEYGSFDRYIWSFTDGRQIDHALTDHHQMPVTDKVSDQMSTSLYKKGFRFIGSTICYSYMQAIGMVNDHLTSCFCYEESRQDRQKTKEKEQIASR